MIKKILFYIFLFLISGICNGQFTTKESPGIFDKNIVSVQLYPTGYPLKDAVLNLNSNNSLTLKFDDLNNSFLNYTYTIIHCSSNWEPSSLMKMDYIDGFFEGTISNYEFSFNTRTQYVHYTLNFPSDHMKPKLSGNYLLQVYYIDNSGKKIVVFNKRFVVIEQLITVNAKVLLNPVNLAYSEKQQIEFNCITGNNFNSEPLLRFKATVQQNNRWDNALYNIKPTSANPSQINFNYPNGILFNGGNEPRFFDMKSFRYLAQNIKEITPEKNKYFVVLHTSFPRTGLPYETYNNIHGKELITARPDQNPNTEGDYATVKFTLKIPQKSNNKDIYILGELSNWQYTDNNKLHYNQKKQMYEGSLFLKQGYYEYWYSVVTKENKVGTIVPIEGNHWQTNNNYSIYIYYHNRMPEYDRLVGYKKINSQIDNISQIEMH